MDFEGKVKNIESSKHIISQNSSKLVFKKAISEILNQEDLNNKLLFAEIIKGDKILDTRIIYFTKQKNLELNDFSIETKIKVIPEAYEIILKSNTLIKNLFIELPIKGKWSENYFDLLPNIEKRITFRTEDKIASIEDKIKYKSLNQILTKK